MITYRSKAATKKSFTTKGTKNTERKGHKEKLTKRGTTDYTDFVVSSVERLAQIKKIVTGLQLTNFTIKYFAKKCKEITDKVLKISAQQPYSWSL
ncbi:hypothetical protein [Candidatus Kuenenia sp.]|uniref:hypothetical protein n=1 Tax=Candidatus Kuenenia sp. TaxID=2499824 RepID=UPI00322001A9